MQFASRDAMSESFVDPIGATLFDPTQDSALGVIQLDVG